MGIIWEDELPADDPIFGKTHFVFFAGPMLTAEELVRKHRIQPGEEEGLSFAQPSVPGRTLQMGTPDDESA